MSTTNLQNRECCNKALNRFDITKRSIPGLSIAKHGQELDQSISEFNDCSFECPTTSPRLSRSISTASARFRSYSTHTHSSRAISSPRSPVHSPRLNKVFSFNHPTPGHFTKRKSSISQWFNTAVTSLKSKSKPIDHPETVTEGYSSSVSLPKSKWRPSLAFIYDDTQLLTALTTFMHKQYNEENILFLQYVQQLNQKIDTLLSAPHTINYTKEKQINYEIINIYNEYIVNNAPKQVNLSYHCFTTIMSVKDRLNEIDLAQKKSLFNLCVSEIERLIQTAILSGFYSSNNFQYIATQRPLPPPIVVRTNTAATDISYTSASVSTLTIGSVVDAFDEMPGLTFDTACNMNQERDFEYLFSFKGYNEGCYEWKIQILKANVYRYEIGIVSTFDKGIKMSECGICDTDAFGARVVYGYENESFYYASFNRDNTERCRKKDLSALDIHREGWKLGDVIKIYLNLNKKKIKFYLNDKQVRRALSIENTEHMKYYPIIHCCGDGEYKTM